MEPVSFSEGVFRYASHAPVGCNPHVPLFSATLAGSVKITISGLLRLANRQGVTDPPFATTLGSAGGSADRVPPRAMTSPHSRTCPGARLTSRGAPGQMARGLPIETMGRSVGVNLVAEAIPSRASLRG